ncbi:MAG TPA: hypothetical protein PLS49_03605 [Candidatus Woesebacteria bacterium]|nr:hypothetical protein [Candidatus Woesebacteria bacterium]
MSQKSIVMLGMVIGSLIGGYIPTLFGVSVFSYTAIFFHGVGGIVGIIIAYKLSSP